MIVYKKKTVITLNLNGNASIQTKIWLCSGSFKDGFYCFWLISPTSVATPVILIRFMEVSTSVGEPH